MKHRVYPPILRQLQFVGHPADLCFNTEWTYETSLQLGWYVSHPEIPRTQKY